MRPKPNIVLENIDSKTYKSFQIIKIACWYGVFYDGSPVNSRVLNTLVSDIPPRYKNTVFSTNGNAVSLANKLNNLFKTDKFTVKPLKPIDMDDASE